MDDLPADPQVAIDCESDESRSTTSTNADTSDTEPFPDYDESECEMLASTIAAEKRLEEAWIYALGKAAQEEIRMLRVDPNIIPYPSQRSQVILGQLQDLLSEPQLRLELREQFITIINATIRLNIVISHQSSEFLAPREIKDSRRPLDTILKHVKFMEDMLKDQLQTAEKVSLVLKDVSKEDVLPFERLRKMASVVAKNMKKPRYLEQRLLALYMDMYEEWVRVPFLRLRKPQLLDEQFPNFPRTKIFRHVLVVWEAIHRCTDSYDALTRVTQEIKRKYFAPSMGYLCDSPEIWKQCWERYQTFEKDQPKPGEHDFSECIPN
ncbi:hypothetical protein N7517_005689 [Penicillium concentricum]|uniref:Uncharacterized protein n=1 Tax=Penicillium concentricum TaxID=293559 RepID=A0A9W9S832_9EURO|nr:uncharacterized protein N7517_005689 [Penicillium concentricum]KAJ5373683.1 hypothetical protein N7517_005689 [Penicillium concentricum]